MQKPNERVWREWNALGDEEAAPVKAIARKLDMSNADVAAIVYPPATFGDWADWHEPPLDGDAETPEDRRRRTTAEQRARRFEVDDEVRQRALGGE